VPSLGRERLQRLFKVTPEEAISFIEAQGVVLESGKGPIPNLADTVAGKSIKGSYWGHAKGNEIFLLTRAIRISPALPEKIGMDDWEKRDELLDIAQKENLDDTFKWIEANLL